MFTQIATLTAKLEAIKEEMSKLAITELKSALKEVFERFPQLSAVRWQQYTAYFNDGEPCYFSVRSPECLIENTDKEMWDGRYGDWEKGTDPLLVEVMKEFSKALDNIEEQLQMSLGDHVEVYCTREGIEVSEYTDHE